MKEYIDIDWVLNTKKALSRINALDIDDIIWVKDGKTVEFSSEDLERFQFMGLNNTDLIDIFPYREKER